jgi:hypothetical protein
MKLTVIVFEDRDDPTLRLHSAWDEEQVASDPELVSRQVADAFSLPRTARAGVRVIEVDDAAIRSCLVRSLPHPAWPVAETVRGVVDDDA